MMDDLGYDRIVLFGVLRLHGLMSPLYVKEGQWAIAPGPCFLASQAERVSTSAVCLLIDYWFPGRWMAPERRQNGTAKAHSGNRLPFRRGELQVMSRHRVARAG